MYIDMKETKIEIPSKFNQIFYCIGCNEFFYGTEEAEECPCGHGAIMPALDLSYKFLAHKTKTQKERKDIKRIFENNQWIIDLMGDKIRISYFEHGHFVDEMIISAEMFKKED